MTDERKDWQSSDLSADHLAAQKVKDVLGNLRDAPHFVIKAMAESRARDDEGQFEPLMDLIDFSGENKTHTVLRAAWTAAIDSILERVVKL